jgi:aminodeoxyfutalosine deaminase
MRKAERGSRGLAEAIRALPKAELHLHLEGSIRPPTAVELAARHGVGLTVEEAQRRYRYTDFDGFLGAFAWVVSFLRTPADYALITRRLADELLAQGVVYAEVITAVGVMLWQRQDAEANFAALAEAAREYEPRGLAIRWLPDAAWQFGADAALEVARRVVRWTGMGVIGFGMGGDELMFDTREFRPALELAASHGLHRTAHAGEVGPPAKIRDAVEVLGAERVGHGIAAIHDPALADLLAERGVALDICPTSNVCTGALACQLGTGDATLADHPLPRLLAAGVPVTLSTDDPAMFHTDLLTEYTACAAQLGMSPADILRLLESSFQHAFLSRDEKSALLARLRADVAALDLGRLSGASPP